jgi:Zn finger protein HypA/HybF involved in hydrogenase expression
MAVSTTHTCKCKKQEGWITKDKRTEPCPDCGRIYEGRYNAKTLKIEAIEIEKV